MFKKSFKFYKRVNSLEHQSDVIDFENLVEAESIVSYSLDIILLLKCTVLFMHSLLKKSKELTTVFFNNEKEKLNDLGLKNDLSDWRCYEMSNIPGKILKIKL